jgi:hypothetical protein
MPIETVALTYIKMAQWVSLRCGKPKPPMRRPHRSPCNLFSAIKSPPESLFVLRASAHTVGHVLRNHMPHLGAMDCPMRYGALLRCFHMLVGGDWTGWLGREDSNLCIPEISMRSFTCRT